jgi:hypothetical protein
MPISNALRDEICKRLGIREAAFYNHVNAKASEAGIIDRQVAALLLGHELKIDVSKPRFNVPPTQVQALQEYLSKQGKTIVTSLVNPRTSKSGKTTTRSAVFRKLIRFQGKYPDIFFDKLEREINTAYNNPDLPNAVVMLSRKLIENLLYRLMQMRFSVMNIEIYFDKDHSRPQDFSVLLKNLRDHKKEFSPDLTKSIDKFLQLADSFRLKANANTHEVMEYLSRMSELQAFKIPEMTQILLTLISAVQKEP